MKANGIATHLVNRSIENWSEHKKIMRQTLCENIENDVGQHIDVRSVDYNDNVVTILHDLHTLPNTAKNYILERLRNTNIILEDEQNNISTNIFATLMYTMIDSQEYKHNDRKLTNDLADVIMKETNDLHKIICPGIEIRGISVYVEESNTPGLFYSVVQYVYIMLNVPTVVPPVVPDPPKPKRNRHKNRRRNQAAAVAASLEVPGVQVASDLVEDLHEVDEDPC